MEATERRRTEGIIVMSIAVPDSPKARGVKSVPETGKESPRWAAGTVVKRATRRASARRRRPISYQAKSNTVSCLSASDRCVSRLETAEVMD